MRATFQHLNKNNKPKHRRPTTPRPITPVTILPQVKDSARGLHDASDITEQIDNKRHQLQELLKRKASSDSNNSTKISMDEVTENLQRVDLAMNNLKRRISFDRNPPPIQSIPKLIRTNSQTKLSRRAAIKSPRETQKKFEDN